MPKINRPVILRFALGTAAAMAFGVSPQFAQAQAPGALAQFASPNNCIEVMGSQNTECPTTGSGLNGAHAAVVSPDGKNVYVASPSDDAIAEFMRNGNGTLSWIGCIADSSDSINTSCTQNATATGLVLPQAIAISPNGENVYVAGSDSGGFGDLAEFTRNANGTLSDLGCIAEHGDSACNITNGQGLASPDALAVSPNGDNVYVVDQQSQAVTTLTRDTTTGSLSESGTPADDCIQDSSKSGECSTTAPGLSAVTGVVVSPKGDNVYTAGESGGTSGSIAEFSVGAGGLLTPMGCVGSPEDSETCGAATGVLGITGLAVSPDGNNVYTASQDEGGPIAEFSRAANGTLTQLPSPNDCIQEQGNNFGCGSTGVGIGSGDQLVVSSDGANIYAAAPTSPCFGNGSCDDVAEFARDATTGVLSQLASPDSCIQDQSAGGSECPGNENGTGLGEFGIAISPDANNVYVTGDDDIAEFTRGTHTLTVSLAGSGSGGVSDGSDIIHCPSACSNAYTTDSFVTLTATPASGSTFAGWSGGGCAGTGTCQVTMSADTTVTASFNLVSQTPGSPTPVLTGAAAAVTDGGAGFSGSVNPEGLPTTAYFQYGLDKRYSQVGASGPNYTAQTQPQTVGSADFTTHTVGPVTATGLVPNALYHVRLVATNSAGTTFGQDVTFTTAAASAPGAPTLGKTFNIKPISGLVLIDINGHLVPLTELTQIPPGVAIDTRHGTLELITTTGGGGGGAHDASAQTQHGEFSGAVFRLSQQTRGAGKGLVTLMLALSAFKGAPSQSICRNNGAATDAHAAKTNSRVIQLLHASAHGKFRTSGRYSAATVLGTIWTVTARCDGTLTHAIKDEVQVTDFVRHKTIILHAGQSYLSPGP